MQNIIIGKWNVGNEELTISIFERLLKAGKREGVENREEEESKRGCRFLYTYYFFYSYFLLLLLFIYLFFIMWH